MPLREHHLGDLVAQFRWMLVARDEFDRFMQTPAGTLTDIQRAARLFYLAKTSFGAELHKFTFGISATGAPRLNLLRIEEELSDAHVRLARVFVENKPFHQVIARFDKAGTLFYVDPPYWGCEGATARGCSPGPPAGQVHPEPQRHTWCSEHLRGGFWFEKVQTRYSISSKGNQPVGDVLITNFKR